MDHDNPLSTIKTTYQKTNAEILMVFQELTVEQMRWRPNASAHSCAFILWHIARWTDHLQATIPGMTAELAQQLPPGQQIWDSQQLAQRWGFEAEQQGYEDTGTGLALESIGEPDWPDKETLTAYAQQVFAAAAQAVSAIDEAKFQAVEQQQYADDFIEASRNRTKTVGSALMSHLVHNIQHLGELHYLCGLLKAEHQG